MPVKEGNAEKISLGRPHALYGAKLHMKHQFTA